MARLRSEATVRGSVAGADLGVVFAAVDVADPVRVVLHSPMAADPFRELAGSGLCGGQRCDCVDGFGSCGARIWGCGFDLQVYER
jgi:hypothetical protein